MSNSLALAEEAAPLLHVEDRDGARHAVAAVEGWRLMEILRDHGFGMENGCGGALACAECHVLIDPAWADRLPPAGEEELDKLDELPLIFESSRLSCQIIWSDDLDGLRLTIAKAT
jgi:ferredoxin-2, mitochondrial